METIAASISIAKRLASDDVLLCARYSIEGGMAFRGEEIVRYRDEIESAGVPLFKTLRSGMDRPLARFEPKDEDWTVVTDIMSGFGASQLDFQSISNLSATDPNLCSAMIRFLEALNQVPGTIGAALRGAFVRDSAAS